MIEFINARTGELIDTANKTVFMTRDDTIHVAKFLARENNDDIYIRWEAGAGSEGEPDTLVTLEEALS